jgi:hypothetical protein
MEHQGHVQSCYGLETHGMTNFDTLWWNLSTPALYEHALLTPQPALLAAAFSPRAPNEEA